MFIKLLVAGAILAVPTLSFGQTVCSNASESLSLNGSVVLAEGSPGSTTDEVVTLNCPGVTFDGVSADGVYGTLKDNFTFGNTFVSLLSDMISFSTTSSPGSTTVTFTSFADTPSIFCPTSPGVPGICPEGTETPFFTIGATLSDGTPAVFTFASDGATLLPGGFSDTLSVAAVSQTPEPATIVTFGTGLLALAGLVRRKLHT